MPPGGSSPSPAQPDRGAPSLEVAVAAAAAAAVPPTWEIRMFLDLFKKFGPLIFFPDVSFSKSSLNVATE